MSNASKAMKDFREFLLFFSVLQKPEEVIVELSFQHDTDLVYTDKRLCNTDLVVLPSSGNIVLWCHVQDRKPELHMYTTSRDGGEVALRKHEGTLAPPCKHTSDIKVSLDLFISTIASSNIGTHFEFFKWDAFSVRDWTYNSIW